MTTRIYILCVDDERDVLESVERDLASLEDVFPIELAENAAEGHALIKEIYSKNDCVGLILCDHIMPGESGVDFLISLNQLPETRSTRKVLLTGQAELEDTVRAINKADLNHYIAKPWESDTLMDTAREQLTTYVIENHLDPLPFMRVLDASRLAEVIRKRNNMME